MELLKFFYPGIGIKRWLGLGGIGVLVLAIGIAYLLSGAFSVSFPGLGSALLDGVILLLLGSLIFLLSLWRLYLRVVPILVGGSQANDVPGRIYQQMQLERGPRIVAIGGGTGLSTLLRGLKEHTSHITAVVTVADDGGSSGRLRRELGVLPPGDFRNCLVALAEAEPLMTQLFQYRFDGSSGLGGHSFGNLFIVALSAVTGSFEKAVRESSRVLAVRGSILPSTLANVTLKAAMEDESVVYGESNITGRRGKIKELTMEPAGVAAFEEAVKAIREADLIVIGPGSLYTSILPNLLVKGVQEAVRKSRATKVLVANVATQPGETDGYSLADHVYAIYRHVGEGLFQYVLANSDIVPLPEEWGNKAIKLDVERVTGAQVVLADLVNREYRLRHDSGRLAEVLLNLYHGRLPHKNHRGEHPEEKKEGRLTESKVGE